MRRRRSRFLAGCLLAGLVLTAAPGSRAADILIGTDQADSIYYLMGRALCSLVNRAAKANGPICEAVPTTGAVFNLTNLHGGAIEAGVVPSDF